MLKKNPENQNILSRARGGIKAALYELSVRTHQLFHKKGKAAKKSLGRTRRQDMIFYALMSAIPILHFLIFYVAVNINFILLSFKSFSLAQNDFIWAGFENFIKVIDDFKGNLMMIGALKNSLIVYAVNTFVGFLTGLLFAFYVYKKMPLANTFRLILFLPSIIPGLVLTMMYGYFVDRAVPSIVSLFTHTDEIGLLSAPSTQFVTILFYCIWTGFGSSVLINTGAMSGIDESIVESAKLDGAKLMREFFSITLPLIWPTLSIFLTVGIIGIFTSQMGLFNFYGAYAPNHLITLGYYMFATVQTALASGGSQAGYPYLSAMGLTMTAIVLPVTLFVRWALEKFGPKTY
ncbi:MAG: sugar ABC transporter permease [Clostridiales bacterium]|jgi:ABC-type sugar transport system permease subunit|nr:sugar ABC transporter permease [Clostridiales bacterium]